MLIPIAMTVLLESTKRMAFSLPMVALLVERSSQNTDLHFQNILTLKSRNRCLFPLSSCTVLCLDFDRATPVIVSASGRGKASLVLAYLSEKLEGLLL